MHICDLNNNIVLYDGQTLFAYMLVFLYKSIELFSFLILVGVKVMQPYYPI